MSNDSYFMDMALRLARRGLGRVSPLPAQGCIIVARVEPSKDRHIVARGWFDHEGHAVARAAAALSEYARPPGSSLEVFLASDPTDDDIAALSKLKPAVLYIGSRTSMSNAAARIESLAGAGTQIAVGLRAKEAAYLNEGFFFAQKKHRPHFTLKMATTLDGSIATHAGESQWITNAKSRALVQRLRLDADGILVGSNTAIVDDPRLTCRVPGIAGPPSARIVADSRLRLPLTSKLVQTAAEVPTLILTKSGNDQSRMEAFRNCGVDVISVGHDRDNRLDMRDAAGKLAEKGLNRILVEGGARLAASLLALGYIDRLVWFHAAKIMGSDGVNAVAELGLKDLSDIRTFVRESFHEFDDDMVQFFKAPE